MESSELRIFQAVAAEGTITKAAERLGYVQSNVTTRIRLLEQELGTSLFQRHNRGMTLSSSGKALLLYADKVIGLLDEAKRALTTELEPGGSLSIGSTQTCAALRLPGLLAEYCKTYPKVEVSLSTGHSQLMIDKVLNYELEGAFIGCYCNRRDVEQSLIFEEELVIVANRSVHDLEEAIAKPILVYSKGCSYREVLEEWLRSRRHPFPAVMEFGTLEAIMGSVAAGLGISLMPKAIVERYNGAGALRSFEIPGQTSKQPTMFICRKDLVRSSAMRAFMETLPAAQ
ncbi:LysR family transcriptional regulator [Paenibacillus sp. HB172176]|uniref:LysR family transcriptional regulator n=1 Tax=Paenibacillus sp. HB172176 TaxID=2493690 RepID=UPI0014397351|nr:LysR family transcriptional regulator [Paenibacillus sp. HB172176]